MAHKWPRPWPTRHVDAPACRLPSGASGFRFYYLDRFVVGPDGNVARAVALDANPTRADDASTAFLVTPSASNAWRASTTATRRSSSRRPRRASAGPRGRGPLRARDRRRAREAAAHTRGARCRERRLRVGGRRRRRRARDLRSQHAVARFSARAPARPDHDRVLAVHALPGDGPRTRRPTSRRAPRGRRDAVGAGRPRGRSRASPFAAAPAARAAPRTVLQFYWRD